MRKVGLMTLAFVLIALLLSGCPAITDNSAEPLVNPIATPEHSNDLSIGNHFKSVNVSKLNYNLVVSFEEKETLQVFQNIFAAAVKEDGIADMADPEFCLYLIYDKDNQQRLYLWIGEQGQRSTLMIAENTHTIYTVSPAITDTLIELIASRFK